MPPVVTTVLSAMLQSGFLPHTTSVLIHVALALTWNSTWGPFKIRIALRAGLARYVVALIPQRTLYGVFGFF